MKVPKKNISSFHDIKPPHGHKNAVQKFDNLAKEYEAKVSLLPKEPKLSRKINKNPKKKRLKVVLAFFVLLAAAAFIYVEFADAKQNILAMADQSVEQLKSAVADIKLFRPQAAQEKIQSASQNLNRISSTLNQPGIRQAKDILGEFIPLVKSAGQAFGDVQRLALVALDLNGQLITLTNQLPDFVFNHQGSELVASLTGVDQDLRQINGAAGDIINNSGQFGSYLPLQSGSLISWQMDSGRLEKFLSAFIIWLSSPAPRHFLVFFDNNSEIRPGGGFLGSYADITISSSSISNIDVRDIYDPDGQLFLKTIPPAPLQLITTNWGARDANWFFDFSRSAAETIHFLEASKMYGEKLVHFDGAVAISPKVLSDLLALVGPVDLPDYNLTIDQNNFLSEIQKQVEASQDKVNGHPKKILQELMPLLLSKLSNLSGDQKTQIVSLAKNWGAKKDLMVYFKNPDMESFFDYYDLSGKIAALPNVYNGDYLAVANANIGSGKTDIFMKQSVSLASQVNLNGTVDNHLVITRTHKGGNQPYWWYRAANLDYLEIFTPLSAKVVAAAGGFLKKITPPVNYAAKGYQNDPAVSQIASTTIHYLEFPSIEQFQEGDRNVFATWLKASAGQTEKLTLDYQNTMAPIGVGGAYQFVFDKQSGATSTYDFQISAPLGYEWSEINSPLYEYQSSDPDARLSVNLTLKKI